MASEIGETFETTFITTDPRHAEEVRSKRKPETEKNELAIDHVYSQKFTIAVSQIDKFQESARAYADKLLNHNDASYAVVFFKVQFYYDSDVKADYHTCIMNFHLFSIHSIDEQKEGIIKQFVDEFLGEFPQGTVLLDSTQILIREDTRLRKPIVPKEDEIDYPQNCCHLTFSNCKKVCLWWWLVPRVQWDFFALLYQMYTFDVFHYGFFPKFVHFFTIPINVALSMMFLAQFRLGLDETTIYGSEFLFDINGSLILMLILVLLYSIMGLIRKCATWGLATSFLIFLLWGAGNCMYTKFRYETKAEYENETELDRDPTWYNPVLIPYNPIMWSYIVSIIQAGSHMFVPQLPPFITGVTHWEATTTFLFRCNNWGYKILALAAFPFTSTFVAWVSWPHLIGTEVFYIMAGIGYNHKYFQKYKLITQKAELSGDPNVSRFPDSFDDLTEACVISDASKPHSCLIKLQKHGLIEEGKSYTPREIHKEMASLHIYQRYIHSRHNAAMDDHNTNAHFLHYKALD